jgi:tRNA pseudouridine55 synthase
MDGLLVIDKPAGPTSHDVVARARRLLREKRIGHAGTLDPMATGVLLLVLGRATRLAKFLSASDKSYDAVVRLGFATDTADAQGRPAGPAHDGPMPSREAIEAALAPFRGTFMQQPPAFSAKKIDGQRSHQLARSARKAADAADARLKPRATDAPDLSDLPALPALPASPALPAPASVTAHRIEIVSVEGDRVTLRVDCSAGFYIRSLAHDLGERLGTGAHLAALRRTRSGAFGVDRALDLEAAERDPARAQAAIVPLAAMLPDLAAVTLTAEGVQRALHGRDIGPDDQLAAVSSQQSAMNHEPSAMSHQPFVRLLDPVGELVAIAQPAAGGLLHPSVVLM